MKDQHGIDLGRLKAEPLTDKLGMLDAEEGEVVTPIVNALKYQKLFSLDVKFSLQPENPITLIPVVIGSVETVGRLKDGVLYVHLSPAEIKQVMQDNENAELS